MYAVIRTGGKQYRVEKGQTLDVERLDGEKVDLSPVLIVDGDKVLASRDELSGATVSARVVGEAKGPKITGFTYKGSTHGRRRWGHRQTYSTIEITGITKGSRSSTATKATKETAAKATKPTAEKATKTTAKKASKATTASKAPAAKKATEASKASKTAATKATKATKASKTTKASNESKSAEGEE
jgi:large subunit ribosomal protein L21